METAKLHPREKERIAALYRYEVLDSESEIAFDELTELASEICGTSISLISLVDAKRQWFKSRVGLDALQTDRSLAFCAHAILQDDVFEVPNAELDKRFADNPLVTSAPDIRFYAGAPLVTTDGFPLGTLCVIDQEPKQLTDNQRRALEILANQVVSQLDMRIHNRRLARINEMQNNMFALISHDLKTPFNGILGLSKILSERIERLQPEKIATSAHQILTSSMNAYQLLEELLIWSRLQLDGKTEEPENVIFGDLLDECEVFLSEHIVPKGLVLKRSFKKDLNLNCSVSALKTSIRNILSNAIKYSPENEAIVVAAEMKDNTLLISVENKGSPMPLSVSENLFKETVDSQSGSNEELGHGIGLKLCHDLLQKINARIWVDADCQDGVRICVSVPNI